MKPENMQRLNQVADELSVENNVPSHACRIVCLLEILSELHSAKLLTRHILDEYTGLICADVTRLAGVTDTALMHVFVKVREKLFDYKPSPVLQKLIEILEKIDPSNSSTNSNSKDLH